MNRPLPDDLSVFEWRDVKGRAFGPQILTRSTRAGPGGCGLRSAP